MDFAVQENGEYQDRRTRSERIRSRILPLKEYPNLWDVQIQHRAQAHYPSAKYRKLSELSHFAGLVFGTAGRSTGSGVRRLSQVLQFWNASARSNDVSESALIRHQPKAGPNAPNFDRVVRVTTTSSSSANTFEWFAVHLISLRPQSSRFPGE